MPWCITSPAPFLLLPFYAQLEYRSFRFEFFNFSNKHRKIAPDETDFRGRNAIVFDVRGDMFVMWVC